MVFWRTLIVNRIIVSFYIDPWAHHALAINITKTFLPINDQELQFFDLCSSLILMTENEKFLNETHVSL